MSIDSRWGMHAAVCDACGETLETEFDFYDAVNARKAAGWKSIKEELGPDEFEWFDYCPGEDG